jgi:transposase
MANRLTMAQIDAIVTLHKSGHSCSEIARLLEVDRGTVGKYVRQAGVQNPQNAPTGSESWDEAGQAPRATADRSARAGLASACEPFRDEILAKLEQGLSARRIHQDLLEEPGFTASYWSVRRFVARLRKKCELPFRRLETLPGEEAQVDFGTGARIRTPEGKRRRPWIFRIVLSHSRKAYSEVVYRQSSESFIQCLENAFRHFGGVPKRLVIDNLKAAVAKADWYDPELHPKLQSFAAHYGTVFLPTKPYTPRHKGYASCCTSSVRSDAMLWNRRGSLSLMPWCFIGRLLPGGSYKHSFLSL